MRGSAELFVILVAIVISILAFAQNGMARPDYIADQEPAPASAEDVEGPLTHGLKEEEVLPPRFPRLKRLLEEMPPFLRDTTLVANPRTYFFERDATTSNDQKAWAIGGAMDYSSGWWRDLVAVGASLYTSQKLHGPSDKDGTRLLKPGQRSFTVLGQAHLRIKLREGTEIRAFRQAFGFPYVNQQDSRMVPNMHEAYLVRSLRAFEGVDLLAGHVRKMKARDSDRFVSMTEVAGFPDTDNGLSMSAVRYSFDADFNIGAITYYTWNFMNTAYAEANGLLRLSADLPLRLSAQYTDQRSVGDALDGDFDTHSIGVRVVTSYRNAVLTLAGGITDENSGIRAPFGGSPSYLSIMVRDFDRAGEDAWLVGLSYNFDDIGLEGLSAYTNYAWGDTPDSGPAASPDREEWDITVDYRPPFAPLDGLWLRLRHAQVDEHGPNGNDVVDYRVILNYAIPLL